MKLGTFVNTSGAVPCTVNFFVFNIHDCKGDSPQPIRGTGPTDFVGIVLSIGHAATCSHVELIPL